MLSQRSSRVCTLSARRRGYVGRGHRRGCPDGVEQLSRYLDLMRRDTLLGTVHGILAAQLIKPQARVLANDRGISCVTVDYDLIRGWIVLTTDCSR